MSVNAAKYDPVTTSVMERPNVRNAADPATAGALVAEFEAFSRDPQATVASFFGSHGTFCAGWDLKSGAPLPARTRGENSIWISRGRASGTARPHGSFVLELDMPVIGAVAGAMRGDGARMRSALICERALRAAMALPGSAELAPGAGCCSV